MQNILIMIGLGIRVSRDKTLGVTDSRSWFQIYPALSIDSYQFISCSLTEFYSEFYELCRDKRKNKSETDSQNVK